MTTSRARKVKKTEIKVKQVKQKSWKSRTPTIRGSRSRSRSTLTLTVAIEARKLSSIFLTTSKWSARIDDSNRVHFSNSTTIDDMHQVFNNKN